MASKTPRVAWDTCVFIDCLQKSAGRIEHIEPMVRDAESGKLHIIASTLVLTETLHLGGGGTPDEIAAIAKFFRNDYIHIYAADQVIAEIARDIRRADKLSTEDAIHLATALAWQERESVDLTMATHDLALATAARASGMRVVGAG